MRMSPWGATCYGQADAPRIPGAWRTRLNATSARRFQRNRDLEISGKDFDQIFPDAIGDNDACDGDWEPRECKRAHSQLLTQTVILHDKSFSSATMKIPARVHRP